MLARKVLIENGGKQNKWYINDYLARFLIDKCKLNPIKFYFIMIAIMGLYCFSSKLFYKILLGSQGNLQGYLSNCCSIIIYIILYPIGLSYYLWFSKVPCKLFSDIGNSGIISNKKFIEKLPYKIPLVNKSWVYRGIIILITLGFFIWKYKGIPIQKFAKIETYIDILMIYCSVVVGSIVINVNLRLMQTFIKNKDVKLHVFHPDKYGGLLPILKYVGNCSNLALATGIFAAVYNFRELLQNTFFNNYFSWTGIIIYLVLAILAIFYPVYFVDNKMKETKEEWLKEIETKFQLFNKSAEDSLFCSLEDLEKRQRTIDYFSNFYKLISNFSFFSSDKMVISRIISPIIMPVITQIIITFLCRFAFPSLK